MIASSGVGWVYVANAISFGFVIVALVMMRDVPAHPKSETGSRDDVSWHAAMAGLRFVFRSPLIRSTCPHCSTLAVINSRTSRSAQARPSGKPVRTAR